MRRPLVLFGAIAAVLAGCAGDLPAQPGPGAPPGPALGLACQPACPVAVEVAQAGAREPMVAVSPVDPDHLVVAALEFGPDEAGRTYALDVSYVSRDGGATFERGGLPPELGDVAEGAGAGAFMSDPVAAVLDDGTVLYAALVGRGAAGVPGQVPATWAMAGVDLYVMRSTDGGLTFPETVLHHAADGPTVLAVGFPAMTGSHDKPWIVASGPTVLLVWSYHVVGGVSGSLLSSVSADHGRTWSAPVPVFSPAAEFPHGSMGAIAADGALHVSFVAADTRSYSREDPSSTACCFRLMFASSHDGGATWETTVLDEEIPFVMTQLVAHDGADGATLWLASVERQGGVDVPVLRVSADGGASWTPPLAIDAPDTASGAPVPALAVGDDGTAYVSYFRPVSQDALERRIVAVREGVMTAPLVIGEGVPGPVPLPGRLGDYMGLAALPDGAYAVWTTDGPQDQDLHAARVRFA